MLLNPTHLQAIVDNLLDGVITIHETGTIESFNLAAESIFGYKAEEVIGQSVDMLLPDPCQPEHHGDLQNYLNTAERGLRKDGQCFPLDLAVNELNLDDRRGFIVITRDITASKLASSELARFKYVLDNTLDMIFMFNADDLQFVYLNRGAIESMGYTREELLQMAPYDIKPMFTEGEFRQMLGPLLNGEKDVLHFETLHRHKNGIDFPVEIFLQIVRESQGVGRFIAIVRDITERNLAEQQAKRYALALEQLHNITSQPERDFSERIHALLELGCRFFNLPLAILSRIDGRRYIVEYVVGPQEAPVPGTEFALAETYCFETCKAFRPVGYHHVGASEISAHPCYQKFALEAYIGTPLLIRGKLYGTMSFSGPDAREYPFNDGDYSLIRIFAQWVSNEITRNQIEDDLQDNATRLASILDTVVDAIITFNESGIIESLNSAGAELFGYTPDELCGQSFMELLTVREARQYKQYLEKYISTGEATVLGKRVEASGLRKDGTLVPIEFAANEMIIGGKRYFTAVVRDISERKKVDRMKSEFVSTVSHELRTPLTSIRGALSLVLGKAADELPPRVRHMLDMANRNSERLTYLVNDILDLEKIDAGHLELDLQSTDLAGLINKAIEENESFAHSHNIALSFPGTLADKALVYVDENRMLQVLANLISNAIKYANENSTVVITLQKTAGRFRVSVQDRGAGIPEKFRSRIFTRFAQADSSDTRDKGGTGLGLAIARAIVERHGGHIDYTSKVGVGTDFFFDIPEWKGVRVSPAADMDKPTVLICEDNADVAEILGNLLAEDGFACDVAATIRHARELLVSHTYRLLMLDLILPDGDGLELLEEIRNDGMSAQLPVIVVSASAVEGRREFRGDAITIVDWIQKPVDRKRFSQALQQALLSHDRPKVLHVEDDLDVVQVAQALLENVADIDHVSSLEQARQRIRNTKYELLILDICLPDGSGLELLDELKDYCPVVIFSGEEPGRGISQKVAASLTKSRTDNAQLLKTVRHVLDHALAEKQA
jgi:PAS domain S-box-containing protein